MNFLIVEDELELLELYDIFLSDIDGISYSLAKDGLEAMALVQEKSFDHIFSDIRMPKMDGFQFLEYIISKKIQLKSFVFITANVDVSREEVLSKGATDILYKPLSHKKLISYIEELKRIN